MKRAALALVLVACGDPAPTPAGPMPAGAALRVAGDVVHVESVAWAAALAHVNVAQAKDLLVRDALFAAQARATGIADEPAVRFASQAVLARALLRDLRREVGSRGPPTDAEVAEITERHWLDLARPEGFRVVHTVVLLDPEKVDAATEAKAVSVAEAIRRAVLPVGVDAAASAPPPPPRAGERPAEDPMAERFRVAAEAVPKEGVTAKTETLSPVASDGRVLSPGGGKYAVPFAEGVARLVARGDVSVPIRSAFGIHVAMLLERFPAAMPTLEERRTIVAEEVNAQRARAAQAAVLTPARKQVSYDERTDALLALLVADGSSSRAAASAP